MQALLHQLAAEEGLKGRNFGGEFRTEMRGNSYRAKLGKPNSCGRHCASFRSHLRFEEQSFHCPNSIMVLQVHHGRFKIGAFMAAHLRKHDIGQAHLSLR